MNKIVEKKFNNLINNIRNKENLFEFFDNCEFVHEEDVYDGDILHKTSTFRDNFGNILKEEVVFDKTNNSCNYLWTKYSVYNTILKKEF